MPTHNEVLSTTGIFTVECPFSAEFLEHLNAALDPIFASQVDKSRAYATAGDMAERGLFCDILNENMLALAFGIMPDPVLYHFHAYEIAANQKVSHIFADRLRGFHCDADSAFGGTEATHVSLFVYLSDVDRADGPFEFVMQPPNQLLSSNSPVATMLGGVGTTFVWNRSFYHRASPNSGNRRRRLLKLSIQRNSFISAFLDNESFRRVKELVPAGQDARLDLLLGRFQGQAAPVFPAVVAPDWHNVGHVRDLSVGRMELAKENIRQVKRAIVPQRITSAAYD
jgi:hypothetical protein